MFNNNWYNLDNSPLGDFSSNKIFLNCVLFLSIPYCLLIYTRKWFGNPVIAMYVPDILQELTAAMFVHTTVVLYSYNYCFHLSCQDYINVLPLHYNPLLDLWTVPVNYEGTTLQKYRKNCKQNCRCMYSEQYLFRYHWITFFMLSCLGS